MNKGKKKQRNVLLDRKKSFIEGICVLVVVGWKFIWLSTSIKSAVLTLFVSNWEGEGGIGPTRFFQTLLGTFLVYFCSFTFHVVVKLLLHTYKTDNNLRIFSQGKSAQKME